MGRRRIVVEEKVEIVIRCGGWLRGEPSRHNTRILLPAAVTVRHSFVVLLLDPSEVRWRRRQTRHHVLLHATNFPARREMCRRIG
jgi:hypothetical protein